MRLGVQIPLVKSKTKQFIVRLMSAIHQYKALVPDNPLQNLHFVLSLDITLKWLYSLLGAPVTLVVNW